MQPWLHLQGGATRPTGFAVFGERSSGTNFARVLLKKNLNIGPRSDLGWKHGFPHALAYPDEVLIVVVFREAFAWLRSMYAKPWHASAALQRLSFSRFIRAEWDSVVNRADYFGLPPGSPLIGCALQHDRHPLTGARFGNPIALRNAKLAGFLGLANRATNVAMIRHEALTAEPEAALAVLRESFGLGGPDGFRGVHRKLGARFAPAVPDRPPPPGEFSAADRAFVLDRLDLRQEAWIGYAYPEGGAVA